MTELVLRSSSSGFAWGDLIFSHYKSSCLRWILIQSHMPYEIDKKYSVLGKENEDRHQQELIDKDLVFKRELEVEKKLPWYNMTQRGHIDFLVYEDEPVVHELKHVQSPNVYREVIKKGLYVTDNLAQCVNYMLHAKTQRGLLKYSYYKKGVYETEREFKVTIDDFGRIHVDKKPTKFTVQDQLCHQRQGARVLSEQLVAQRPYLGETPYVGACHWCPMSAVCTRYDSGAIEGTQSFIELAKQQLNEGKKNNDDNAEV